MKKMILATLTTAFLMTGCTNGNVKTTLEDQGFKKVKLTGYRPFKCSDDDSFHTGFEAISPNGTKVTGTVCEGWIKGKTIRLD
jgi:hypothetical protein